jgi:hypothetical protein
MESRRKKIKAVKRTRKERRRGNKEEWGRKEK